MTPNKSLEDNGGLAGSGVIGSVLIHLGSRAVPQLNRGQLVRLYCFLDPRREVAIIQEHGLEDAHAVP
jgi:hypothetical protein